MTEDIVQLRAEIDALDTELWNVVARRMEVSRRIGAWKKTHGMPVEQPERFQHLLAERKEWAKTHGISEMTVESVQEALQKESILWQSK